MFEYFRGPAARFGLHENSSFNFDKLADPKRGTIYHETSLNVSRESRGHNACHSCAIRPGKICFHGLFDPGRGCISLSFFFFWQIKIRDRGQGRKRGVVGNLSEPSRIYIFPANVAGFFRSRKETKTRFRQEKRSCARNDRDVVFLFFFTIVEQRRSTN